MRPWAVFGALLLSAALLPAGPPAEKIPPAGTAAKEAKAKDAADRARQAADKVAQIKDQLAAALALEKQAAQASADAEADYRTALAKDAQEHAKTARAEAEKAAELAKQAEDEAKAAEHAAEVAVRRAKSGGRNEEAVAGSPKPATRAASVAEKDRDDPPAKAPRPDGDDGGTEAGKEPATMVFRVPADARVTIDGEPTTQRGVTRTFQTPPVVPGRVYSYQVEVRSPDIGTVRRNVQVKGGEQTVEDFRK